MERLFKKRIGYEGELEQISLRVCEDFGLGKFESNHTVLIGYEDFNFVLETDKGKFFVKVFSNQRSPADCKRYVDVMEKAIDSQIAIPRLYESSQGHLHVTTVGKTKLRLSVMEFVGGKTFFSLKQKPSANEIRFLAGQAARINSINIKPEFCYDSWAITNFLSEFKQKSEYLAEDDLTLIKPLVKKFKELKINKLPHCFIHGDITSTNAMRDGKNKIWIIDFAVSNYYPRIQELAVLACDLLFDETNKRASEKNLGIALEEYQRTIRLTQEELDALPTYVELAHAMHLLRANFEKVCENNQTEENEYFLNAGRAGLLQSLQ